MPVSTRLTSETLQSKNYQDKSRALRGKLQANPALAAYCEGREARVEESDQKEFIAIKSKYLKLESQLMLLQRHTVTLQELHTALTSQGHSITATTVTAGVCSTFGGLGGSGYANMTGMGLICGERISKEVIDGLINEYEKKSAAEILLAIADGNQMPIAYSDNKNHLAWRKENGCGLDFTQNMATITRLHTQVMKTEQPPVDAPSAFPSINLDKFSLLIENLARELLQATSGNWYYR